MSQLNGEAAANPNSTVPFFIGGQAQSTDGHPTFPVISGRTGKTVHSAASASKDVANAACDAAATAFQSWKQTDYMQRRELLLRVAELYEERRQQFVETQMLETSAGEAWASFNVTLTVKYLREIAAGVSSIHGAIPPIDKPDTFAFVFRDPIGVILTIAPWNAALVLSTRAIATAIGAGCAVVLKASELCPRTHFSVVKAFVDAGLPSGVLNSLQVRREDAAEVTEELIKHEAVRKIEFIGSANVGRIIASVAAKHLKPVLMELGSKTPSIVLDDADLSLAAKLSAQGALANHGQVCFSTERIIVQRSVAEQFKQHLISAMSSHQLTGDFVSKGVGQHAHDVLVDAKKHGLEMLVGGPDDAFNGTIKPTVVMEPRDPARIVDEETFGPSASLYVVEDDAEAIKVANATSYGLNATIHSWNMERALKMARHLDYGQVHINSTTTYSSPTAPTKGVKASGWGSQNGQWGFSEFLINKFVTFQGRNAN